MVFALGLGLVVVLSLFFVLNLDSVLVLGLILGSILGLF